MKTLEIQSRDCWLDEWNRVLRRMEVPINALSNKIFLSIYGRRTKRFFFTNEWVKDTLYNLDAFYDDVDQILNLNVAELSIMLFGADIDTNTGSITWALSGGEFYARDCLDILYVPLEVCQEVSETLTCPFYLLGEEDTIQDKLLSDALLYWISEDKYRDNLYKLRRDFSFLTEHDWNAALFNLLHSIEVLPDLYHSQWLKGAYETNAWNNISQSKIEIGVKLRELTLAER